MRIFIGSSSDKLQNAKTIAKALRKDGHEVIGWWESASFRGGDFTLQRLIDMSDLCHGAVFIFGKDDLKWMNRTTSTRGRPKGKPVDTVRDNVVLEYGLFVGKHGPRRVAILTQEKVKLPSDLQGVTYINTGNKHILKVREMFSEDGYIDHRFRYDFHVYTDRIRSLQVIPKPPYNWSSRLLYVGKVGADLWERVENDYAYRSSREHAKVISKIGKLTKHIHVRIDNVISIGPGIGSLDTSAIQSLNIDSHKCYVPIDMNYYLLLKASKTVDDADLATTVPFAIHGDFEEGMNEIGNMLRELIGHNLFLMLGGTFGNIESAEAPFFGGLRSCMRKGDYFLLDTFVQSSNYADNKDTFRDLQNQPSSVVTIMVYAASAILDETQETIAQDVNQFIRTGPIPTSDVADTKGFSFCVGPDNKPVLHVRRYHPIRLRDFCIEKGFEVVKRSTVHTDNPAADRGLYLLRRTGN